jgi:hypothetical protein
MPRVEFPFRFPMNALQLLGAGGLLKEVGMRRMKQSTTLAVLGFISLMLAFAGCGGGGSETSPTTPAIPNASVTGQYNLVLTSTSGHGTTNVYSNFTQTGAAFAGSASTLVCPLNDLSKCEGDSASGVSITPNGTVSGTNVKIVIPFSSTAVADTITMNGTAVGTSLSGTYTDTLGDSGTWAASPASYPFGPPPSVNDYSGTFNSTLNPLLLAPTISIELGQNASSKLSGGASITNSPCLTSLTLTGQAIGDALSLTDATAKVSFIALPNLAAANSFNFSYKFDPTAASCPGDFGQGVVAINLPLWDY